MAESQPFIYVGTYRINPGRLEEFKQTCLAIARFVESAEPRVIAFSFYANRDGTEVTCVQVHPDAESMANHMELLREHIAGTADSPIEAVTNNQLYGAQTNAVLTLIDEFDPGVPLLVKPDPIAGFTRSSAEHAPAAS
jgi:hypothetical protein